MSFIDIVIWLEIVIIVVCNECFLCFAERIRAGARACIDSG